MRKALTLRTLSLALMASAVPLSAATAQYGAPAADAKKAPGTIVDVAAGNAAFSTLVTAVGAAGLAGALSSPGPFTLFAPTNDAFAKLPAGTVETLVKPENKAALTGILSYHAVAGKVSAADLIGLINAGGGKAELTTLAGGKLTAEMVGGAVILTDAKGGKARVIIPDVAASNGVIHAIDAVVMP